jgi:HEAT repeat protein
LLNDPELRVRTTVLYVLTRLPQDEPVLAAIARCRQDPDAYVRAVAAVALCRSGRLPPAAELRDLVVRGDRFGNFPFGPASSIGVAASREMLFSAVAPHANAEVFDLLVETPPPVSDYEPHVTTLKALGQSLLREHGSATVLLKAHDQPHSHERVRFAQAVFRNAGKEMLPVLHAALASKDRVVRSNAARACGAIGDASSIGPLIRSLDLESGLARASIVWALGELKASEALPHLAKLYVDAQNDEKRRRGTGFLAAQSQAEVRAQYDTLSRIDALASDWSELQESALNPPQDPRQHEALLSPRDILDAVAKIGPAASQQFYRALAGERDSKGRREAAARLAECAQQDAGKNVPILRNLLADTDVDVRISAAVSLLLLEQDAARPPVLDWLERGERWEKACTLRELRRVSDRSLLDFAHSVILRCASDTTLDDDARRNAQALAQ